MEMVINGVTVQNNGNYGEDEIRKIIEHVDHNTKGTLKSLTLDPVPDGRINATWEVENKFERIRRITGYLVGTTDRWNNANRSEERERVKHGIEAAGA